MGCGQPPHAMKPADIARAAYLAYARNDRAAIETLIDDDFHVTSPRDNRIDRKS
jgi:ketosteroid isomerase-like protein